MIGLGLSRAEKNRLDDLLISHHRIHVRVQLLTLDHEYVGDASRQLLSGQVTIDADAEVTRSLDMELLDPHHRLRLDSRSPEDESLYFHRMIRIIYTVISPDNTEHYDIPIFCGPISKVERQGPVISVTAQGKEALSSANIWSMKTYKKGREKTKVIRWILQDLSGETRFHIVDRKEKLPDSLTLKQDMTPWGKAKHLGRSMKKHRQLFYNGRGQAALRLIPSKTVYVFRQRGALLSWPQVTYDAEDAINAVEVIGGKPKGSKKKIRWREVAARVHPLSPWKLGRNNVPRYLPEIIENDHVKSTGDAKEIARKRLKHALIESVDVTFDSLPIPYLEELDLCRVSSDDFSATFRLRKMTIPLTADGTSSIGYLRRTSLHRRQLRSHHHKRSHHRRHQHRRHHGRVHRRHHG